MPNNEPLKMSAPRKLLTSRTIASLIVAAIICFGAWAYVSLGGAGQQPSAEFLDRRLCTNRDGDCHHHRITVSALAKLCTDKGYVRWENTSQTHTVLRCFWTDELTKKATEFAFILDVADPVKNKPHPVDIGGIYGLPDAKLDQPITILIDAREFNTQVTLRKFVQLCRGTKGGAWASYGGDGLVIGCAKDPIEENQSFAAVSGVAAQRVTLSDREALEVIGQVDSAITNSSPPPTDRVVLKPDRCDLYVICSYVLLSVRDIKGQNLEGAQILAFFETIATEWKRRH